MSDYAVSINITANDQASTIIQNLNTQLGNMGDETDNLKRKTDEGKGAWDNYKNAIAAVGVAWGTLQIAGKVLEFVELGNQVNATSASFTAFSGSPAEATTNLEALRVATRGVVDDMTLMQSGNRYMSMGLAQNTDEMAELVNMAVTLGRVMGHDASESVDNFGLLLANQSVLRLDTFGISASAVRDRINELKESGIDAQEAFTMATLEQGRLSLERLGDAADAGATALDRMQTRWQNVSQNVAGSVATIVDQALTSLEMLAEISAVQDQLVAINADIQFNSDAPTLAELYNAYQNPTIATSTGDSSHGGIGADMAAAQETANNLAAAAQAYYNALYNNLDMSALVSEAEAFAQGIEDAALAADSLATIIASKGVKAEISEWHTGSMQVTSDFELMNQTLSNMTTNIIPISQITGLIAQGADAATASFAALDTAMGAYDVAGMATTTTYGGVTGDRGSIEGQALFTDAEAQAAQEMATYYNDLLADATQLHTQGLITDTELANVQSTADAASALADNAERGAEAFANMTLSQAFGQQSGGMGGEIQGDVTAYMQAQGMSEQEIAQYTQTTQLATGQQTQSSLAYENTVVPMIADIAAQYGAQAAAEATMNVQAGMQTGAMVGMTDQEIANNMAGMTGYSTQTASAMGFQGLGTNEQGATMTATEGFDIETYMTGVDAVNAAMTEIADSGGKFEESMARSAINIDTVQEGAMRTAHALTSLDGKSVRMTANIAVNVTNQSAFEQLILQTVRNNGGTTPGTDDRAHPGGGGP